MGIIYCEKDRTFTLQTKETTYQMQVDQYGFLLHLYYGKKAEDGVVHEFEVLCYSDTPAVKFNGTIPVAIEVPPAT